MQASMSHLEKAAKRIYPIIKELKKKMVAEKEPITKARKNNQYINTGNNIKIT